MGQLTYGILVGTRAPEGVDLYELAETVKPPCLPAFPPDSRLVGFWVAVGASGKKGVPYLGEVRLGHVDATEPYAKACSEARRQWMEYARWAREQGVEIGGGELWLAEAEVG